MNIEINDVLTWKGLGVILLPILSALLMGKTFRTLLIWPFHYLARKSKSDVDNKIIAIVEKDLGITEEEKLLEGNHASVEEK